MKYTEQNAAAWDRWVEEGIEWGKPISGEAYSAAQRGEWSVLLTPSTPVPKAWFPRMRGARVLGLASAGGQQMPIFTALGAACTVLDLSDRQLESERMVAARERYAIDIVQADMTEPLPLESDSFDLIFHPVSNCYIRELQPVWDECFRVLRPGGVLLAGVDNGLNFLFEHDDAEPLVVKYALPFDPLAHPEQMAMLEEQDGGVQFSHSLTEQIGGQLKAGFRLTDLYEDRCGDGRCVVGRYMPEFYATRAVKPAM